MKRRVAVLGFALAATGCAALIGASFDDAGLAGPDAAPDVRDGAPLVDVGSNGDGEAPFDPLSLPNLGIWLDATYQVDVAGDATAGAVTRWHDRSVYGRDAVPAGSGTNPPTLVPNALYGRPVVHFTASQLDLLVTPWTGPGTSEMTMFLVTRGYPNSALRFQTSVNTFPFVLFPVDIAQSEANPNFVLDVGTTSPTYVTLRVPIDAGPSLAAASWSANGTADTYTGGVLAEQRITTLALPSGLLYIGGVLPLLAAPYTTVPFANGDIAEAIVYTNALEDADRAKVEAYLRTKWGIAP